MIRIIAVIAILSTICFAEDVSDIRQQYNSVKESIDHGDLYITELTINSEGMMYPALGTYGRSFKFYWGIDEENYPGSQLLFITVNSQYAAVPEYEEFLFNSSGELVFCFRQDGYDENEERFYFSSGSLIRYILDDQSTDRPDESAQSDGERVFMAAENLLQAFILTH